MREAVIVSTARTGIGKANRGYFNNTEATVLGDRDPRLRLGALRDGIFQVDDHQVGGAQPGLLELAG